MLDQLHETNIWCYPRVRVAKENISFSLVLVKTPAVRL